MAISHSKCATARGCWKKYYWKYVKNLEPIRQSHAITIGKVLHETFELFYKGFSIDNCHKHIEDSFDIAMSEAEAVEQEDLLIAKWTTLGMWDFYPHKQLDTFQEIIPEMDFKVRVGRTRNFFLGRVDGFVKQNNLVWVREVKTTGMNHKQFGGRMRTSAQATGYVYATEKMIGIPIAGVMVDCIKKTYLRKRDSENAEEFAKRIYEDYRCRTAELYSRHFEYRPPESVKMFEEDVIQFVRELRKHELTGQFYRNQEQCWNFNSECPYMKICFRETRDPLTLQLMYKEGNHGGGAGSGSKSDGGNGGDEGPND